MEEGLGVYLVRFSGLKTGLHTFDFDVDNTLFETFDYKDFDQAKLTAHLKLDKKSSMLDLNFNITGKVRVPCDRCGELFDLPLDINSRQIIKFGEEQFEQTDEILIIPHNAYELNVGKMIYEFTILGLPYKKVHEEGGCNPEVLKKLEEQRNKGKTDDRWDALKELKEKM